MSATKLTNGGASRRRLSFICIIVLAIWIGGCKSSEEAKEDEATTAKKMLQSGENNFTPSDYDDPAAVVILKDKQGPLKKTIARLEAPATQDTVSGYRIQVLFTPDIERAAETKDTLSVLIPEEYTYVVYEAPYYKVRLGNFQDRSSANIVLKKVTAKGFDDAWVVPDKIITNLPPKNQGK
jgi:hypothetical protein